MPSWTNILKEWWPPYFCHAPICTCIYARTEPCRQTELAIAIYTYLSVSLLYTHKFNKWWCIYTVHACTLMLLYRLWLCWDNRWWCHICWWTRPWGWCFNWCADTQWSSCGRDAGELHCTTEQYCSCDGWWYWLHHGQHQGRPWGRWVAIYKHTYNCIYIYSYRL